MPPEVLFDLKTIDPGKVLYNQAQIMEVNPQRFEMLHLTAVVHVNREHHVIVGYKDVGHDEFWVRGHMPGFPLLPGVLMCEAAAQLTGFYSMKEKMVDGEMIVFSGMNNVLFRGAVKPGDRFWIVAKATKINRRRNTFSTQGLVGDKIVFEGEIEGMPFTPPKP